VQCGRMAVLVLLQDVRTNRREDTELELGRGMDGGAGDM
jgi:hypothetical protein